jgi:hypothetical protein
MKEKKRKVYGLHLIDIDDDSQRSHGGEQHVWLVFLIFLFSLCLADGGHFKLVTIE